MFVSEKLVFIQLQKTAGTHLVRLLSRILEGERVGRHDSAPPELLSQDRIFVGSIRDPWEWYLSLWAYGCDGKGAVHDAVTMARGRIRGRGWREHPFRTSFYLARDFLRDPEAWRRLYSDVADATLFRQWLYRMHDERYWSDLGDGYRFSPVRRVAGLLTYRYMKLFCRQTQGQAILSLKALREIERRSCYIDYFIRNENLEEGLIEVLERCGIRLSEEQKRQIRQGGRSNVSSRRQGAAHYYDTAASDLVGEREKLIVDNFGYLPPGSAS